MYHINIPIYLLFIILFSTFMPLSLYDVDNLIANSQSQNSEFTGSKFEDYHTPEAIQIRYPEVWNKVELPSIEGILFHSPAELVGVIVQNRPANNISIENELLNEIFFMHQNLPNMLINNFTSSDANNIFQQELIFTFGNDSLENKVYQFKKIENLRLYEFTFFADKNLFDRYVPIASKMLSSFVTPSNHFPVFLNDNIASKESEFIETGRIVENASNKESTNRENGEIEIINQTHSFEIIEHENLPKGINFSYPDFFNLSENSNGIHLITNNGTTGFLIDLQSLMGQSLTNFTDAQISYLENNLHNFSIVNSMQEILFQKPTQMVYFSYLNNSKAFDGLQIITNNSERGYIFTYFSSQESFNMFLPYIIDIIDSTVLLNG